ncbi:threonine aldolase family protein [Streptomyces chiangmaiensis]
MIDLRSDTCSRPTPAMRHAMAQAEVGDDVYGDDPTVKALEERTAHLLGKEDAVYMPTGTMTNQVGIRVHTEPGDAVLFEQSAHVYLLEGGAPSAYSGVLPRLLPGTRGVFTAEAVRAAVGSPHPFFPSTVPAPVRLLCVENTHNNGGGTVWPLEALGAVAAVGRERALALHLDGARLWHASVASGVSEAEYAAPFDTVSVWADHLHHRALPQPGPGAAPLPGRGLQLPGGGRVGGDGPGRGTSAPLQDHTRALQLPRPPSGRGTRRDRLRGRLGLRHPLGADLDEFVTALIEAGQAPPAAHATAGRGERD